MVLPKITVITITVIMLVLHLVGKVITRKTYKLRMHCSACSRLCQYTVKVMPSYVLIEVPIVVDVESLK